MNVATGQRDVEGAVVSLPLFTYSTCCVQVHSCQASLPHCCLSALEQGALRNPYRRCEQRCAALGTANNRMSFKKGTKNVLGVTLLEGCKVACILEHRRHLHCAQKPTHLTGSLWLWGRKQKQAQLTRAELAPQTIRDFS